ncbi:MAG: hypothetical protein IAE77_08785 [Prosthecobacter sp.]|jgi:hypothetical protein|uniref:hypothetical protein n=1 Tax=Prosthecobacter sp. TaxID=1965333 RepID=UPI0019DC4714|nr:hypothetical protein [Prosthecobacter sp.]MBE2283546.1 hypothetical protein [Prosthecobacter sp.]
MKADEAPKKKRLRVIKTARTEAAINQAAKAGFRPLVRPVKPSKKIHSKFSVWQNQATGEIEVVGDFRSCHFAEPWTQVIGWTEYYPHAFPEPFAAYLIPPDLQPGERVLVKDLIEDFVGTSWNQGDNYRLESGEAVWDGEDLKIDYQPSRHRQVVFG